MKNYTLNEEKINNLRSVFSNRKYSEKDRNDIIRYEIIPEVFKNRFEVGKYYFCKTSNPEFYVKCTELTKSGSVIGYGIEKKVDSYFFCNDRNVWFDEDDNVKEITRDEFLEQVKKYAIEELGFKEGIRIKGHFEKYLGETVIDKNTFRFDPEWNFFEYKGKEAIDFYGFVIFWGGQFVEIVEEPKDKKDEIWNPTMELRYRRIKFTKTKILEQKMVEQNTGEIEWRKVEGIKEV